jgi:hypothetical protein
MMVTRRTTGVLRAPNHLILSATSSPALPPVPTIVRDALADPQWRRAMEEEYEALQANHTWDLVPRPHGTNMVTEKWIFKLKLNADGSLEVYKARYVLRDFTQRPGVDYDETFSPVVKPASVRTVLTPALSRDWPVHQLDVKNAFLHGTLTETVYCTQPVGFIDPAHPDMVCRLNKSLYSLKQHPRAWYGRFATFLCSQGFVEAKSDTSLFILYRGPDTVYLLLYVDDIVLTASTPGLLRRIISCLQQEFGMKDLGRSTTSWGSPSSVVPRACPFTNGSTPSTSSSTLAWPSASPTRPRWTCRARSPPPRPRSPIRPATRALPGHYSTSSSLGPTSPTPSSRCASTCTTLGSRTSPQ